MSEKRSLYRARKRIHPKVIKGKTQNIRLLTAGLIYGVFVLLPWLQWGDRPAVYFNLVERQFHIFNLTFWPQDFMFLAWFLIIAAFSLFLFTTVAGRLWCGFACPQTIWTLLFIWIEDKIEGPAHTRKRLDNGKLHGLAIVRRVTKHIIWLLVAFGTAITFVSYFFPIRELLPGIIHLDLPTAALVFLAIFTYLTYIDAAILREQVCFYMCPYARFQSVMYDKDTLIVAYDADKGEPRGSAKSGAEGQCIDCSLCVQVCPTGIDIREGLQIGCINCGLCVDACDQVMSSIDRPQDLINFSALDKETGRTLHLLRPKIIAYCTVLAIMVSLFGYNLLTRSTAEASIIRDRDQIYRLNRDGTVANYYTLRLGNKSQETQNYTVRVKPEYFTLSKVQTIQLVKGELSEEFLTVSTNQGGTGSSPITFEIISTDNNNVVKIIESRFIFPRRR